MTTTDHLLTEQEARRLTDGAPCVYALVDVSGTAIYVGATRELSRRVREHATTQPWWPLVKTIESYPQPTWSLALYVERGLIRALSPEFNRQSVDDALKATNMIHGPVRRLFAEMLRDVEVGR